MSDEGNTNSMGTDEVDEFGAEADMPAEPEDEEDFSDFARDNDEE